jgi:hypothetical protein
MFFIPHLFFSSIVPRDTEYWFIEITVNPPLKLQTLGLRELLVVRKVSFGHCAEEVEEEGLGRWYVTVLHESSKLEEAHVKSHS